MLPSTFTVYIATPWNGFPAAQGHFSLEFRIVHSGQVHLHFHDSHASAPDSRLPTPLTTHSGLMVRQASIPLDCQREGGAFLSFGEISTAPDSQTNLTTLNAICASGPLAVADIRQLTERWTRHGEQVGRADSEQRHVCVVRKRPRIAIAVQLFA